MGKQTGRLFTTGTAVSTLASVWGYKTRLMFKYASIQRIKVDKRGLRYYSSLKRKAQWTVVALFLTGKESQFCWEMPDSYRTFNMLVMILQYNTNFHELTVHVL